MPKPPTRAEILDPSQSTNEASFYQAGIRNKNQEALDKLVTEFSANLPTYYKKHPNMYMKDVMNERFKEQHVNEKMTTERLFKKNHLEEQQEYDLKKKRMDHYLASTAHHLQELNLKDALNARMLYDTQDLQSQAGDFRELSYRVNKSEASLKRIFRG